MNFKEIQLLEYAIKCVEEIINNKVKLEDKVKLDLLIKSSDDIFSANSLATDSNGYFIIKKIRDGIEFSIFTERLIKSYGDDSNPFMRVRSAVSSLNSFHSINDTIISMAPDFILPQVIKLIEGIENELDSQPVWYNYESKKNNLKLDYCYDVTDDYKVISLIQTKV